MARQTVLVSDLTGETIPDGEGATVRITVQSRGPRGDLVELHTLASEVQELIDKGRTVKRRGRLPKLEEAPAEETPAEEEQAAA